MSTPRGAARVPSPTHMSARAHATQRARCVRCAVPRVPPEPIANTRRPHGTQGRADAAWHKEKARLSPTPRMTPHLRARMRCPRRTSHPGASAWPETCTARSPWASHRPVPSALGRPCDAPQRVGRPGASDVRGQSPAVARARTAPDPGGGAPPATLVGPVLSLSRSRASAADLTDHPIPLLSA